MTYCLGIKLDAGLVFASNSRITAGTRYVGDTLFGIEQAHDAAFRSSGVSGSATLILGGQIAGREVKSI